MKQIIINIFIICVGSGFAFAQTLDDYFLVAAENNPQLKAKYKMVEASLQKVAQTNALPDPTFSFGYFVSPVETRVGAQQARFSLTQLFPWFGTLKAKGNVAALQAEANLISFLDERNKLFYQVSIAYYPLYELKLMQKIEQNNINILHSYKTITNAKFKNGLGTMVDVLRVDIMLNDAEVNLKILTQKEKALVTQFNTLLNRNENDSVNIIESEELIYVAATHRKDSLFSNNLTLKELDVKIKTSAASEIVARKQGLPNIGVGLDYVIVNDRTDMVVPDNGKDVFMPMVSISLPIYRKKYNAQIKEAQLMQESYVYQKEQHINTLIASYETTAFEINQQKELIHLYHQQIEETNQMLRLLFSGYANTGNAFEEVLRTQQQGLKYEKLKATAQTQYQIAVAKLNYLTSKTY